MKYCLLFGVLLSAAGGGKGGIQGGEREALIDLNKMLDVSWRPLSMS